MPKMHTWRFGLILWGSCLAGVHAERQLDWLVISVACCESCCAANDRSEDGHAASAGQQGTVRRSLAGPLCKGRRAAEHHAPAEGGRYDRAGRPEAQVHVPTVHAEGGQGFAHWARFDDAPCCVSEALIGAALPGVHHAPKHPIHPSSRRVARPALRPGAHRSRAVKREGQGLESGLQRDVCQEANCGAEAEGRAAGFVRWEDVDGSPECRACVQEPAIKRKGRALQKLLRLYGGDVSLLVDVARTSIVFAEIQDLRRCLGEIAIDKDVYVERVKNRLSDSCASDETAGYRDLCINLRITSSLAVALGVEMHMCEVQLLLKSVAEIKQTTGHKNYVKFRDSRAI